MATERKNPFSVAQGVKDAARLSSRSGDAISSATGTSSVTMKKTPAPSDESFLSSVGKTIRGITAVADRIGLDAKPGFQNTFGSIKGEIGAQIKKQGGTKKR